MTEQAEVTARAAETLYRERQLTVRQICDKLGISKTTLYAYLRHPDVQISPYQRHKAA